MRPQVETINSQELYGFRGVFKRQWYSLIGDSKDITWMGGYNGDFSLKLARYWLYKISEWNAICQLEAFH
jgi:hypothetical protein